jgi:hypothetical protein
LRTADGRVGLVDRRTQIIEFYAFPARPADRPYLASAMLSQLGPDSLDVIGGGNVVSGVPRWMW